VNVTSPPSSRVNAYRREEHVRAARIKVGDIQHLGRASEAAHARSHSAGTTQENSGVFVIGDAHECLVARQSPRS
jgi:hypothetical protein